MSKKQEPTQTPESECELVRWNEFDGVAALVMPADLKIRMGDALYREFEAELNDREDLMIAKMGDQAFQVRLQVTTLVAAKLAQVDAAVTSTPPPGKPAVKARRKAATPEAAAKRVSKKR